jgi:hypothetical protein
MAMNPTTKDRLITGATLLATAAAVFAVGYSLGKDTNDGTTNFLREKYSTLEKSETVLRAENASLRVELEAARRSPAQSQIPVLVPRAASSSTPASATVTSTMPAAELQVRAGATVRAFDGEITISLIGTEYEGTPLRYKVIATLGSPGKESKTLSMVDVGFSVGYGPYEVRVLSSGSSTATFLVTKLASK